MARPFMPRIYYKTADPSVHLEKESMDLILKVYREKKLSYGKLAKMSGVSADVVRHFISFGHIRLSQLKAIVTALELKVLYEQTGVL